MSPSKKEHHLREGQGIATQNPDLVVRSKVTRGLFVLIYDQVGKTGGLIHLLEDADDFSSRIRRLNDATQAKKPAAKLVGLVSIGFLTRVKNALVLGNITLSAESIIENAEVTIITQPALGKIRYRSVGQLGQTPTKKVRVLIVDDAPVIRKVLSHIISQDPELELVGEAGSAAEADELLKTVTADVLTLDIHMPVEDGVSFLGRLMAKKFIPVVIVTSLSMAESEKVFEALSLGAIDYIQKPAFNELEEVAAVICEKLKVAAKVKEKKRSSVQFSHKPVHKTKRRTVKHQSSIGDSFRLVAIGASTGGVQALTEILCGLPEDIPPIVIVQHIPPVFSRAFAERLDTICPFKVKEAEDGDPIVPGQVLLAPGGTQMRVENRHGKLVVGVFNGERVNRHKPSVEVLFKSVAKEVGSGALGVILTGMGEDGAEGLLMMRQKGAATIAQDEATSVVFGMPGAAIRIGAAQQVLPLPQITTVLAKRILRAS